jgi:hypothetical protein
MPGSVASGHSAQEICNRSAWICAYRRHSVLSSRQWQRVFLQPYELTCLYWIGNYIGLIASSAFPHDVRTGSVEIEFEVGL